VYVHLFLDLVYPVEVHACASINLTTFKGKYHAYRRCTITSKISCNWAFVWT